MVEPHSDELAGACGTYCGACYAYRGELAGKAASLLDDIRRQGFLGLARKLEPSQSTAIEQFEQVLDRIARTPPCPGCGRGGGISGCPVRACANSKHLGTCADCSALKTCSQGKSVSAKTERARRAELTDDEQQRFPFSASQMLQRLSRKYQGWNLANLEQIRKEGLAPWLDQIEKDPNLRTAQKKSPEDVWND